MVRDMAPVCWCAGNSGQFPGRRKTVTVVLPPPISGATRLQARRVVSHVDTNLSRRIPVQELARLLGLSASHFCRAFKCTFGTSPRHYVLGRRIEVAQGLMLTTSEPLSSIAIRCGMCDQPHFTRSFHRIVGETPYSWRRTRRGSSGIT
jgi:AraC family transcriptional regulator